VRSKRTTIILDWSHSFDTVTNHMDAHMNTRSAFSTMLFCGCLFGHAVVAAAQYPATVGQSTVANQYYSQQPTVSPYLNLLNNPNPSVTNYQSLVRPMIDEREALTRQSDKLQQQRRGTAAGKRAPHDDHVQAARFLNYSHYYGDWRR